MTLLVGCGGRSGQNSEDTAGAGSGGTGGSSGGASSARGGASSVGGAAALDCQDLSGALGPGSFELVFDSPALRIPLLVPRDDGALVAHRDGGIVVIELDGSVTPVSLEPFDRAFEGEWHRSILSPRGNALLATQSSRTAILNFASGEVAVFEPADSPHVLNFDFSNSGNLVITLFGLIVPERQFEHLLQVRRLNGEVISNQPPRKRLPLIPATDDTLIWREDKELVATDFDGAETFRFAPGGIVDYVFASTDGRSLLVESGTTVTLMYPALGLVKPSVELGNAARYRALSSSGTYVVLSPDQPAIIQQLYLGALQAQLTTGIVDYSSLDVNDDGNILAAGLAADQRPLVELLTWDGGLLFSCFSQPMNAGPLDVGFTRDGRAYALFRDRLLVFNVPKR